MCFLFQLPSGLNDYEAVMVFFHGGGFGFGSGNTELVGPDYLLEAGVVIVSVNYRLGPLGKSQLRRRNVRVTLGRQVPLATVSFTSLFHLSEHSLLLELIRKLPRCVPSAQI
jgi:hypothetical protein